MAYNRKTPKGTLVKGAPCVEGESIEVKVSRLLKNKEPLENGDSSPEIFMERSEGINAAYNIRTDRFELAASVMDKITKQKLAKRDSKPDLKVIHKEPDKKDDVVEPQQGKADDLTSQSK